MSEPRPGPDPTEWADPRPTYEAVATDYAAKFLGELADKPFDRDLLGRFAAESVTRASQETPVCDLGCGPGQIGAYVASHGVPVVGIDLSAAMVAEGRRAFPHLRFEQGDMTALAQPDGAFAAMVCFYAIIHLPRTRAPVALAEMHRTIVPGGDLLLSAHGGEGSLHAEEMLEHPVSLDATLFALAELSTLVVAAGFVLRQAVERPPYEQELATQRLYVWASRPS